MNQISKSPYELVLFSAKDINGNEIYHTNVIMSVLAKHIIICIEAISDENERKTIEYHLKISGKKIIIISLEEMMNFGGNIISIKDSDSRDVLILCKTAFSNYRPEIIEELKQHYELCISDIPTIENVGGGSCRCMVAQIFTYE